jgi:hypothetical protein
VEDEPEPPVEEGAEESVDDEAPVGAAADVSVTAVEEGAAEDSAEDAAEDATEEAAEEAAEEESLPLLAPPALTSLQISAVRLRTVVRSVGSQVEATQGAAAVLMVSWAEPHWQV